MVASLETLSLIVEGNELKETFMEDPMLKEMKPYLTKLNIALGLVHGKGQLNSEWIYEVIISPKKQTKNYKVFWPTKQTRIIAKNTAAYAHQKNTKKVLWPDPCLFGRAEILVIFGLHFVRNDDLINSFWI